MADLEKARAREGTDAPPEGSHLMGLAYALAPFEWAPSGTTFERQKHLELLVCSVRELMRRAREARANPADRNAATFASFEAAIKDSLTRIEHAFRLKGEGTEIDALPRLK